MCVGSHWGGRGEPHLGLLSTVATHMCWEGTAVHFLASRTKASASTKPNPYRWLTEKTGPSAPGSQPPLPPPPILPPPQPYTSAGPHGGGHLINQVLNFYGHVPLGCSVGVWEGLGLPFAQTGTDLSCFEGPASPCTR